MAVSKDKKSVPSTPGKNVPLNLNFLFAYIEELERSSPNKQILVSAVGGWLSGMMIARVGRSALLGLGISGIALHFAQKYGYVTINGGKINQDIKNITEKHDLKKKVGEIPKYIDQYITTEFLRQHGYTGTGYIAGLILGLATN